MPSLLGVKLTPGGNFPCSVIRGDGQPLVVTVKLNLTPNVTVSEEALVKVMAQRGVQSQERWRLNHQQSCAPPQ